MKTLLTAITISLGFILASIGGTTNQPTNIAPKMSARSYKVAAEVFYSSLKHQITPKDGESDIKLLCRYFQEHHIDLDTPKASVFMNEKKGWLFVSVIPEDQDKVERLVCQIANTKRP